jgi:hypothetical protein
MILGTWSLLNYWLGHGGGSGSLLLLGSLACCSSCFSFSVINLKKRLSFKQVGEN